MVEGGAFDTLWATARDMDATLRVAAKYAASLARKQVHAELYSRGAMFQKMARREVAVFRGVPILVRSHRSATMQDALVHALSHRFPPRETSRVQVGPSHALKRLPVREIMRRWLGGRAIVGVTDLHIRGTRVEEVIDTRALSDFNTLIRGSDHLSEQEMMTLVIASKGNVTDSHSDDPDGTNHCFFGKKLWLAWDAFEGMAAGLEDVERQHVSGEQAAFDIGTFVGLRSSRWFLVSTGDTLYLPGNLTHKVLTLESYLGVGSFHIGLPGSLDTFTRWLHRGPLWSMDDRSKANAGLVDEAAIVTLRIADRVRSGSSRIRERWGFDALRESYEVWKKSINRATREEVLQHRSFRKLVEMAQSA